MRGTPMLCVRSNFQPPKRISSGPKMKALNTPIA
jgi:hypothetical protein